MAAVDCTAKAWRKRHRILTHEKPNFLSKFIEEKLYDPLVKISIKKKCILQHLLFPLKEKHVLQNLMPAYFFNPIIYILFLEIFFTTLLFCTPKTHTMLCISYISMKLGKVIKRNIFLKTLFPIVL